MSGDENLYRRAGIWWMRLTVKGREIRESLRTRDRALARKARDRRREELTAEAWHGERVITWADAVDAWSEHADGQMAPATAKRYAVSLLQCHPWLAEMTIGRIDGKTITALISGRLKAGASPATVRRDLTAISQVLDYAEARDWREGNPARSKRVMLKERRDPIVLPRHEAIETMIAAASPQLGALIRAAWLTGCRQDELARMTWRDYAAAAKTMSVVGKGNKRRVIRLSDAAAAHFSAQPRHMVSPLIFHVDGAQYRQIASDFCHVRRRALKADPALQRFRFHDLRHLFAVEALAGGMDIYTLSKHLGHTSVKTTEIYLDFLTPDQAEAAKRAGTNPGTPQTVLRPKKA